MIRTRSLSTWKARHAIVVWIGVILNLCFVLPLIFCPEWLLSLFGIVVNQVIWAQFAGLLLGILSIFYIPASIDIDRYRIFAWLQVFPSRTAGVVFFLLAVTVFDQPIGYITGVLLDGSVAIPTLICLLNISRLEQELADGGRP
jgi:hypothetical protein